MDIKTLVEDNSTRGGRIFDFAILALIVLSLLSFCIETLPDLPAHYQRGLRYFEIACVVVFTIEYLLRLWVADNKQRFVFSFFGIVDLIAILPFYVGAAVDLRSVRVFRVLRVVRALKLLRYSRAILRFRDAFKMVRAELVLFFLATMFLLFVASVGIYYFEHDAQPKAFASVFHSFWWAVVTITTVGCPATITSPHRIASAEMLPGRVCCLT